MRTGPDLFNIGSRQPSADWHLGHLYQPRAYVPGSTMPAYRFMFKQKPKAEEGEIVVKLPPGQEPPGQVTIASQEALDLVKYLQAMNHTYPAIPPSPTPQPSTAK
jgi:cytochrome c oxidase cbb3-type subunit 2